MAREEQSPEQGRKADGTIVGRDEFERLYASNVESIVRYVTRRAGGDGALAADLVAETFALAFQRRDQFRGTTAEEQRAWLLTIARTQLNHHFRRLETERRAVAMAHDLAEEPRETAALIVEGLSAALAQLPADQRVAVFERIVLEHDYESIASRHGITEDAARARVSRGLRALAAAL